MQALVLMRLGEEDINEWAGLLQKKKKKKGNVIIWQHRK